MLQKNKKKRLAVSCTQTGNNEEATVANCAKAMCNALDAQNEAFEKNSNSFDYFSVVIAGEEFQFLLGGPQTLGLCLMLDNIARENFYKVPFNARPVNMPVTKEALTEELKALLELAMKHHDGKDLHEILCDAFGWDTPYCE